MLNDMFTMKPSEARKGIIKCFSKGLAPMLVSSPGTGKSTIFRQIASDFNLEMIDLRMSQLAPEDLMGLPMRIGEGRDMKAAFAPFEMFPTEDTPLPKGKVGWLLFLDEFNSGSKSVQAAAYKLMLDRMVGQANLHPEVFVAAAGNLASDKAIVNAMSTAMQSRLVHIEMAVDFNEWMKHAVKSNFDYRVTGFLDFQPEKLMDFKPDHQDKTFACPRTWEFASRLIEDDKVSEISLALMAGTLSKGVAVDFMSFLEEFEKLPTYAAILSDPEKTGVPDQASTKFALISMLMAKLSQDDFPEIVKYVLRMPPEFQVLYFRGVLKRDPKLRRHPAYVENILHITRFLHDDDDDDQSAGNKAA